MANEKKACLTIASFFLKKNNLPEYFANQLTKTYKKNMKEVRDLTLTEPFF